MNKILLLTLLLLCACYRNPTYKELIANAKYKVGDIVTIDQGYYKGCTVLVKRIAPLDHGAVMLGATPRLIYYGTSECIDKNDDGREFGFCE